MYYFSILYSFYPFIKGPKGPEPALGFFEKNPDCPTLVVNKQAKQQKFSPNKPGGRANVFSFYVIIIITLTFSSTLRYRSGRSVFVYVTLP